MALSTSSFAANCGAGTHLVTARSQSTCVANSTSASGRGTGSAATQGTPDVARLAQQIEDATGQLHTLYWILGFVVALGFGASAFSFWTITRRESKLAIAGE